MNIDGCFVSCRIAGSMVVISTIDNHSDTSSSISSYYYIFGIALILFVVVLQRLTATFGVRQDYKFSPEAKRRIQHGMTGCILVLISYCIPIYMCILLLIAATYIIYYLKKHYFHTIYIQNFGPLLRDHEKQPLSQTSSSSSSPENNPDSTTSQIPLPGAYYFLLGTTITTILFPIRIARYSVLCLSLADPMAAYIGQSIPSYRLDQIRHVQRILISISTTTNGTISGCIACFISAWLIGFFTFILPRDTATVTFDNPIISITAGAMTCCFAEAIPFFNSNGNGNDNLQIPIFTALIVTMFSR